MDVNREKIVSVFGGSRVQRRQRVWQEAHEVGRRLVEAGFSVANGGYGGLMEAVSQGAHEAGGHVIGVTCQIFKGRQLEANGFVTREIETATIYERMQTLVGLGDGFLTLRGSVGTLSELTMVWSLFLAGDLDPRPLILLGEDYGKMLAALHETTGVGLKELRWVRVAASPEEAVAMLAQDLLI